MSINFAKIAERPLQGGKTIPIIGIVSIDGDTLSKIVIWDGSTSAEVDPITGSLRTISVEHAEIHEGEHFFCGDDALDVDTGTNKYWHVKAPNTAIKTHLRFRVSSSLNGTVRFYEDPNLSTAGTPLVCFNNFRDSLNVAETLVYVDPGVTAVGTQLFPEVMGSDGLNPQGSDGGLLQRVDEIILGRGKSYLLEYDTETNDNRVSFLAEFYEE